MSGKLHSFARQKQQGFTIVEVIVVIVVIVTLAIISVVGYGAWRDGVAEDEVISNLNAASASMKDNQNWSDTGFATFPDGTVFGSSPATSAIFTPNDTITVRYDWGDEDGYCLEGFSSVNTSKIYYVNSYADASDPLLGSCPAEP